MKNSTLFKIFGDYRLFEIFILGIISGMPLAIIGTMIVTWLTESDVTLEIITTFAIARLPYSLKPLWSPIIDYCSIPFLSKFGRRASWMICCSSLIACILYSMSILSPNADLSLLYILTICLGTLSATFDISFDAFRIEKLEQQMQGVGAACAVFGYRIGLLITGGGALYLAHINDSWPNTLLLVAGIFVLSTIFIFFIDEAQSNFKVDIDISWRNLQILITKPFMDFLSREGAIAILLVVIFFKLGDAMLGVVSMPFYLELGFSKQQIAVAVKIYGFIATILGTYAGGLVIYKIGYFRGLIISGIIQSITHLAFVWLNHQGTDFSALFIAISIENFAGGMGSSALVAYLSILCNKKYSATQYALFSSAASLFNNTVTIYGGTLVRQLGWDYYFIFTIILAIPAILLLVYLQKKYNNQRSS
ncbi:Putative AmpG family muropeptide MFS transporter [Candidatus Trichorickettsia mobilis]|uniref:AmpG family muropeptide MFS transporter n=1 Tax=Candidatus Trichorickettsia mobilis TaxID=1346319 RepID=A0ABZ0URJ7_9RICK|nr:MFS transporter [Candidatus Trichorickettsia mobilis]WPY00664.1 Putative AmpG family muropeptide MFS transporter [Candidatus Trichorickettsia mobilis]